MKVFEKILYNGGPDTWYAYFDQAAGFNHGAKLKKCPFCGGGLQVIHNGGNPSYWIECACGAEMHAHHSNKDGSGWSDLKLPAIFESEDLARSAHEMAIKHIIDKWNRRK